MGKLRQKKKKKKIGDFKEKYQITHLGDNLAFESTEENG